MHIWPYEGHQGVKEYLWSLWSGLQTMHCEKEQWKADLKSAVKEEGERALRHE
eukprot:Pgem_evm1s1728